MHRHYVPLMPKKTSERAARAAHDVADLFKAFADPTRVRILAELGKSDACVHELCDALQMTQTAVSHHLSLLRQRRLVTTRRAGRETHYSLAASFVPEVIDAVKRYVEAD
jgi:ArsR family transcriptional regulator, lead/cadmium/zinc/bismuth-responsive transcriptional repressor